MIGKECSSSILNPGGSCCSSIQFQYFDKAEFPDNNEYESKKKRKREDDEKAKLIGLISIVVLKEEGTMVNDSTSLSLLFERHSIGKVIITRNSSLLNDLPFHSESVHDQLVGKIFVDERLSFHVPVEKEKEFEISRLELRAYSGFNKEFEINDSSWSSPPVFASCLKPEIKKTSLSGFISVERTNCTPTNIIEIESNKTKVTLSISFLKNGKFISSSDLKTILGMISGKDRCCEIKINNEEILQVKETSLADQNENRKLHQMCFSNLEQFGIKLINLNTISECNL